MGELTNASASAQEQHQLEQGHAKELRRLRHDVECLHGEKERLREELQEKDREREELQNNFLYVKAGSWNLPLVSDRGWCWIWET